MSRRVMNMTKKLKEKPPEVTPDQRVGMIMGLIEEMHIDEEAVYFDDSMYVEDGSGKKIPNQTFIANLKNGINNDGVGKVDHLFEIRYFAEEAKYEPLEAWANETINFLLDAEESDDIEEIWKLYSEGMDNLQEMSKTMNIARS